MFDLSKDVNKELGIDNANVKVFPVNGYGNPDIPSHELVVQKLIESAQIKKNHK